MDAFDKILYEEGNNDLILDVLFNEDGNIIDNISGSNTLEQQIDELKDHIDEDIFDCDFDENDELFNEECFI